MLHAKPTVRYFGRGPSSHCATTKIKYGQWFRFATTAPRPKGRLAKRAIHVPEHRPRQYALVVKYVPATPHHPRLRHLLSDAEAIDADRADYSVSSAHTRALLREFQSFVGVCGHCLRTSLLLGILPSARLGRISGRRFRGCWSNRAFFCTFRMAP